MQQAENAERAVLFLQGPLSPLYRKLADRLKQEGFGIFRIHFCLGDALFWKRSGGIAFRGKPAEWRAFIAGYLDSNGITDVVLHGDRRFYHRIAIEEAKKRGLYVAVSELGLLRPDWTTFERSGLSLRSHFPDDPDRVRAIAAAAPEPDLTSRFKTSFWKVAAPDIAYNLVNTFLWFAYPHYRRHTIYFPPLEYVAHALRLATGRLRQSRARHDIGKLRASGRPIFLFPMQLEGDFQLRENSPFSGMVEALDTVCASFSLHAPTDAVLLLKSHPLDNGLHRWDRIVRSLASAYGLEGRIVFADGGDLFEIAALAKGAIAVNSTAGLDLMRKGLPVKTLAPAIFDIAGMTDRQPLETYWHAPCPPDRELVDCFVKAIAATIQVRGTIYDDAGLAMLVETMAGRLIERSLNEPGGYCPHPPRLCRLASVDGTLQK